MDENILEVRHLHTDFVTEEKTVQAVNDVSFVIKRGETFGLIGESGCGKSVTCRSLIRLLKEPGQITGGEILYKGRDILDFNKKELQAFRGREIGMIFRDPMTTLNPVQKAEAGACRGTVPAGGNPIPEGASEMLCPSVLRWYAAACHDCHCPGVKAPSSAGR